MPARRLFVLLVLGLCAVPRVAPAASYRGRIVDGHAYPGRIQHPDYGAYDVTVEFDDDRVQLRFMQGGRMIVHLEDPVIDDPGDIPVLDHRRGVTWSLRVDGLGR